MFQIRNIWNSFAGLCALFQSIDSRSIIFLNSFSKKSPTMDAVGTYCLHARVGRLMVSACDAIAPLRYVHI